MPTSKNVECPCERCNPQTDDLYRRFTMCPDCGNKRCPKGTDHTLNCTGSNEPGQPGSSWANYTGPENVEEPLEDQAEADIVAGHLGVPLPTPENVEKETDMRVKDQKVHGLRVTWTSHGGEMFPEWTVDCPYEPDDYDKPCRIWASEDDHTGESEPGCWVQQSLDEGIECVRIAVPPKSTSPWLVYVTGYGDEGPMLTDQSLTPENVEGPT